MANESIGVRVNRGLSFLARYFAGTIFLIYASPKLTGTQFRVFQSILDTPLRDLNGFWMAWSFFGYSYYYQLLIGLAEITVAFLLFFRRTKTLGAICALPIVINVVMVDVFFRVDNATPVAVLLFAAVVYLVARELPGLKVFLWDRQQPSSGRLQMAASGLYGVLLVAVMAGILVYVNILTPHSYLGSYTIEQYSVNGVPVALKPGDIGTVAKAYLEYNRDFVLRLNGETTIGRFTIDPRQNLFTWAPDFAHPESVLTGTYSDSGGRMTLQLADAAKNVEFVLDHDDG